jgi:hypothetical protein
MFAFSFVSAQQPTGNKGPAQRMSDSAKQEMVKKNSPDTKKKEHVAQKEGFLLLPGFEPTGNKAADKQNYQTAKAAWIQANPAEYRAALKKDPSKRSGAQTVTGTPVSTNGLF